MNFNWETFAASLESPQGSTFYALIVLLLLSAASLWLQRRAQPGRLSRPIALALGILMGLRLLEVAVFAMAWGGNADAARAMAPFERSLHLLGLISAAWLWTRPTGEENRQDSIFGLVLLGSLVLGIALHVSWLSDNLATFNYTNLDYIWSISCGVVLLFAFYQLVRARQTLGLVFLTILMIGQVVHLFLAEPFGNMPLATEAATLLGLLLLFLVPVGPAGVEPPTEALEATETETTPETDLEAEGKLAADTFNYESLSAAFRDRETPQSADQLSRRLANEFGADICAIANHDGTDLNLFAGYNILRETPVEPGSLPLAELPEISAALRTGEPVRLSADERLMELGTLSQAFRLSFQASLLFVPIANTNTAILMLSLEKNWQLEDETLLQRRSTEIYETLDSLSGVKAGEATENGEPLWEGPARVQSPSLDVREQLELLEAENERYREDIERLLAHIDELKSAAPAADSQPAVQSNELVQALQLENERLKSSLASAHEAAPARSETDVDTKQAKEELRLAMEEVARLHEDLAAAQREALAAGVSAVGETAGGAGLGAGQMEVIASIAQELRQPLSSIVGYTDLLLGESVGILGALQRKFLERVRNSTLRMNTLIDNLIRIAELDEAGYSATRKPVDLSGVIDDAIGQLRTQLQEKRIAMRVDLPEKLPELNTDRDALQQILYHLLQNADSATPAEGAITLRAFIDSQKDLGNFVLIQVSDSGGGIPDEDLPRVFSRVYRASNPVIPGVGDTGVGLTIAETLTQALGGRIWVESQAGVGATFSVLLPLNES